MDGHRKEARMTARLGKGCPHEDIRFCPLYHASHGGPECGYGLGCEDGRAGEGGCAVDRAMNYLDQLAKLEVRAPRMVAQLKFREEAEARSKQRLANMRVNGIH